MVFMMLVYMPLAILCARQPSLLVTESILATGVSFGLATASNVSTRETTFRPHDPHAARSSAFSTACTSICHVSQKLT